MTNPQSKRATFLLFDGEEVDCFEFAPLGQTVSARYYVKVLKRLKQRANHVRSDVKNTWKLHYCKIYIDAGRPHLEKM